MSDTQHNRVLGDLHRKRWAGRWTPGNDSLRLLTVQELQKYDIFQLDKSRLDSLDAKKSEALVKRHEKMLDEIRADVALANWEKGAVLFEEGSYIDLAFVILSGQVTISVGRLHQDAHLGRPIFDPMRTMVFSSQGGDVAEMPAQQTLYQTQIGKQDQSGSQVVLLTAMDIDLPLGDTMPLGPGDILGEIGALNGWPQSVTARVSKDCQLLQIRVAALRKLKENSPALREKLEALYRERSLFSHLKNTPLLAACSDEFVNKLAAKVELISCEPDELVTKENDQIDAMYLVRSGFLKLSQQVGAGEIVVSYLSKGMTLGEESLLTGSDTWQYTASSVKNTELVKILKEDFLSLVSDYPEIEAMLWESLIARIKEAGVAKSNLGESEFIGTALDRGWVQGNSILAIDLNKCTRCDDCVRACAETHGGIPRFVREGEKYQNLLITRACYHCQDPVCLVGCPTGAIRRTNVGDVVAIDDRLCIGCSSCAESCPYDVITMYDTGKTWPEDALPAYLRGTQREVATKCDLCYGSKSGPACVNNCPHGCAVRVASLDEFQKLMK